VSQLQQKTDEVAHLEQENEKLWEQVRQRSLQQITPQAQPVSIPLELRFCCAIACCSPTKIHLFWQDSASAASRPNEPDPAVLKQTLLRMREQLLALHSQFLEHKRQLEAKDALVKAVEAENARLQAFCALTTKLEPM
jgi:hypothetical protein